MLWEKPFDAVATTWMVEVPTGVVWVDVEVDDPPPQPPTAKPILQSANNKDSLSIDVRSKRLRRVRAAAKRPGIQRSDAAAVR